MLIVLVVVDVVVKLVIVNALQKLDNGVIKDMKNTIDTRMKVFIVQPDDDDDDDDDDDITFILFVVVGLDDTFMIIILMKI